MKDFLKKHAKKILFGVAVLSGGAYAVIYGDLEIGSALACLSSEDILACING